LLFPATFATPSSPIAQNACHPTCPSASSLAAPHHHFPNAAAAAAAAAPNAAAAAAAAAAAVLVFIFCPTLISLSIRYISDRFGKKTRCKRNQSPTKGGEINKKQSVYKQKHAAFPFLARQE